MTALNYQNILLWRHAHAKDLADLDGLDFGNMDFDALDFDIRDSARPLSKKGQKQAEKMAAWLKNNMPKDTLIVSSNALRAKQTAQALGLQYIVIADLAPNATLASALKTISELSVNNLASDNLLLVGHQPWLGLLAAQLLYLPKKLPENAKEISIKKGAVWWFKRPISQRNQPFKLFTVLAPSTL